MLEILALKYLYRSNKLNAIERGRKPGLFTVLTFVLWFGFELAGFALGGICGLKGYLPYFTALAGACFGGLLSVLISKFCRKGSYITPEEKMMRDARKEVDILIWPATVEVVRASSPDGSSGIYPLTLNDRSIGILKSDETVTAVTDQKYNTLSLTDAYGQTSVPLYFTADNGSHVLIECSAGKLLLKSVSAGTSAQPGPKPTSVRYCRTCGWEITRSEGYCGNCGTNF